MSKSILLFIALLTSCSFGINTIGYTSPQLSLDEAWKITSKFKYISDVLPEYWKSPREFERDGGGDCEDFAAYMLYLLGRGDAIALYWNEFGKGHCAVYLDGEIIEPQTYGHKIIMNKYDEVFGKTYTYYLIMPRDIFLACATGFGSRGALKPLYLFPITHEK